MIKGIIGSNLMTTGKLFSESFLAASTLLMGEGASGSSILASSSPNVVIVIETTLAFTQ